MYDNNKNPNREKFVFTCSVEELSENTIKILNRYGTWMAALTSGRISPSTKKQARFVSMHLGNVFPVTPYEYAWFEYRITCLYEILCQVEKRANLNSVTTWKLISNEYKKLASVGHYRSRLWLEQHGRSFKVAKPFCLDPVYFSEIEWVKEEQKAIDDEYKYKYGPGIGQGECYFSGYAPNSSNPNIATDETDWSDRFDDIGSAGWEDMLGGSDIYD